MYVSTRTISSTGVSSETITATGVYRINIDSVPGVNQPINLQAGEVTLKLAGTTPTATVQLQSIDGTAIGDSMSLTGTSVKCVTASSAFATFAFIGPRYANVSALSAGATLTVTCYFQ